MKKINENTKVTLTFEQLKRLVKEGMTPQRRVVKQWFESPRGRQDMAKQIKAWFKKQKAVSSCHCDIEDYEEEGLYFRLSVDIDTDYTGYDDNDRDTWDDDEAESYDIVLELIEKCPLIKKYIVPVIPCDDDHWSVEYNQGESIPIEDLANIADDSTTVSEDDEGPADVDAAVKDLFDMYQACKVEPKVCNAITADGKKTNIFLDKGNSVGGIARALRDGRLLKVIGFN